MTYFLGFTPSSNAFFATSPAAIMTEGLAELVHEVIEAMATDPSPILSPSPILCSGTPRALRASPKAVFMSFRGILS